MISRMRSGGWQRLVLVIALAVPGLWCFARAVFSPSMLAYRDASHFYVPLETWLRGCWQRGEWPLWNPQDGLGLPMAGEASSALFYPGRLVTLGASTAARGHVWYTLLHLIIAASGAYSLARWGSRTLHSGGGEQRNEPQPNGSTPLSGAAPARPSIPAAGLCAVTYAFGGAVLFQYCNTIYLVGAAWLPWTLLATERTLSLKSWRWGVAWGTGLALMVLGGDPQTAYHAGLLGLLYQLVARHGYLASERRLPGFWFTRLLAPVGLAGVAAVTMLLLAAVQFVPAWSWTHASDRVSFTLPRNVYEIPEYWRRTRPPLSALDAPSSSINADPGRWRGVIRGLFGPPPADEHRHRAEEFSLAPWRLVEVFWPNISGRTFPTNHRWLTAVAAEDRIWVPSLYLGIVPILAALGTWRVRRADVRVRWFSWIVLLAVAASFGRYGLGLAGASLRGDFEDASGPRLLADSVGGLYWWMVVGLPGYVEFRFPAKWLVPATLGIALLAAVGLDRMLSDARDRLVRHLRWLGLASLVVGLAAAASKPAWIRAWAGSAPDELYGPLDAAAAWWDIVTACGHSAAVCGVAWWLVSRPSWRPARTGLGLLLLTAGELAWAQGWMVQTAPVSALETPTVLDHLPAGQVPVTVYRWPSRHWVPSAWPTTSSDQRPQETLRWDIATLYGRLNLLGPDRSVHPLGSMPPRDLCALLATGAAELPHAAVLNLLGVEYLILPADWAAVDGAWEPTPVRSPLPNVAVWHNPRACPLAWIVHDVEAWPRWDTFDPQALHLRCAQLVFPAGQPRDFRRQAVVETDAITSLPACLPPSAALRDESVRCLARTTTGVELEVELASPGLVVVNQYYDPHWQASVTSPAGQSREVPIVRANRVQQGVFLPPGRHALALQYRPHPLYWSAAISAACWLLVLAAGAARLVSARFRAPGSDLIVGL